MVVLKEQIFTVYNLEGCGGTERTHLPSFSLWEDVVS